VKGAIGGILLGGGSRVYGPPTTAIGDNNDFGLALIMILPLLFYQWHFAANRWLRHGLMCMGALLTVAVVLTYSRGALLGLVAMATVLLARSRARLSIAILVLTVGYSIYHFLPESWFNRMHTIEEYQEDPSAETRIYMWKLSLQIADQRPLVGGGFKVTYWPEATNPFLSGTDLPDLMIARATHSIYFDVLSEHGYVGLGLFLLITLYSWFNCSWLVRHSRDRPDLAWADQLGRMGHSVLIAYWTAGAFASQAYLDEYWCVVFLFDAARRIVAKEASGAFDGASSVRLRNRHGGVSALVRKSRS
jgi:probable O-glycosylation ligase (exosortase A-associated)